MSGDIGTELQARVERAFRERAPLAIVGGGSKGFYGHPAQGESLGLSEHRGIVSYEPTELVITARAGTPLRAIEAALAEHGQMLPFEPPHFGEHATLGGTIACNFSGPRRPYTGAARDFVLGCKIINGKGELLRFGGEVMKNVAGYDVSRLMCGALGTLGVLLEVSLKILPQPEAETTLVMETPIADALARMHAWARLPLPISAAAHDGVRLHVRLSGTPDGLRAAQHRIGGEPSGDGLTFWHALKEHRHAFFDDPRPLWRLSLAFDTAPLALGGEWLYEWGGAQRWLLSTVPAAEIRGAVAALGGHATLFRRGPVDQDVFHPLPDGLMGVHRKLKHAFDPHGILNPGRLYREF